jgi:hypothetical protein
VPSATPFERSARFWLGAYPRRWRDLHGEEVLGVLDDVYRGSAGDLPDRLPRAESLGLLRAGWALRWHERPGIWRWCLYRCWTVRLRAADWPWVVDDIRGRWYPLRCVLGRNALVIPFWVYQGVAMGSDSIFGSLWAWAAYLSLIVATSALGRNQLRRGEWTRHVVNGEVPWEHPEPYGEGGASDRDGNLPAVGT